MCGKVDASSRWPPIIKSTFLSYAALKQCSSHLQVEEYMKTSVHDIIDGCLEAIGNSNRVEWSQEWPCQSVLVAEFINATTLIIEA